MNHPLDPSRLKIIRAEEHLHALRDEIVRYMNTKPYECILQSDGKQRKPVVRAKSEPPQRLSAIVGDCIYNARTALDYLAWQLGLLTGPKDPKKARIYFPIFKGFDAFKKNWDESLVKHLPASTFTPLENVQPYHSGYDSLVQLHALSNEDKHRLPILALSYIVSAEILTTYTSSDGWVGEGMQSHNVATHQLGTQREIVGFAIEPEFEVEMDGQATGFVAFADPLMPREPVDVWVNRVMETIRDRVIPKFESFF
jgi:hypothetical protein